MHIPYGYLAALLVFTLFIGVVIGDRLAADTSLDNGGGHSGGCSGLATARLHADAHRVGYWRPSRNTGGRPGSSSCPDCWSQSQGGRDICGANDNSRDDDE